MTMTAIDARRRLQPVTRSLGKENEMINHSVSTEFFAACKRLLAVCGSSCRNDLHRLHPGHYSKRIVQAMKTPQNAGPHLAEAIALWGRLGFAIATPDGQPNQHGYDFWVRQLRAFVDAIDYDDGHCAHDGPYGGDKFQLEGWSITGLTILEVKALSVLWNKGGMCKVSDKDLYLGVYERPMRTTDSEKEKLLQVCKRLRVKLRKQTKGKLRIPTRGNATQFQLDIIRAGGDPVVPQPR